MSLCRKIIGIITIIIGIIGIFFPMVPGIPLILAGITLMNEKVIHKIHHVSRKHFYNVKKKLNLHK